MSLIKKLYLRCFHVIQFFSINLLCANECIVCKKQIFSSFPLCKTCTHSLFLRPMAKKLICKSIYFQHNIKESVLEYKIRDLNNNTSRQLMKKNQKICASTEKNIEKIYFLYPYVGKYIDVVLYWKTENMRGISQLFAHIIAHYIKKNKYLQGIPIIPVPPRPAKLRTKGWDQIEDICSILENFYSLKILRSLKRLDGHSQKGLSKNMREHNLLDKIYIKSKCTIPKKVILLDDVITTGSTIKICTNVLYEGGVEDVLPLVLFFN